MSLFDVYDNYDFYDDCYLMATRFYARNQSLALQIKFWNGNSLSINCVFSKYIKFAKMRGQIYCSSYSFKADWFAILPDHSGKNVPLSWKSRCDDNYCINSTVFAYKIKLTIWTRKTVVEILSKNLYFRFRVSWFTSKNKSSSSGTK